MSGGSFNYLCHKSAGDLLDSSDLEPMAQELEALGPEAREAAESTRVLTTLSSALEGDLDQLRAVWRAVEWWRSGDSGLERVREALASYRAQPDGYVPEGRFDHARLALRMLMADYSEEYYAAGWLLDIEKTVLEGEGDVPEAARWLLNYCGGRIWTPAVTDSGWALIDWPQ